LAVAAVLVVKGSGAWSIDRLLLRGQTQATREVAREPERLRAA
jgi:hypothetical protein